MTITQSINDDVSVAFEQVFGLNLIQVAIEYRKGEENVHQLDNRALEYAYGFAREMNDHPVALEFIQTTDKPNESDRQRVFLAVYKMEVI